MGGAAIVAILALTGCAGSSAPSASPAAPDPSPTTTTELGPAALVQISPVDVSILDAEGDVIGVHDFAGDVQGMVELLETAFGVAPDVVTPDAESCSQATHYTWGDGFEFWISEAQEPPTAPFTALEVSSKVASIGAVKIVTSTGFGVGDDLTDVIAGLPADQVNDAIQIIWERSGTVEGLSGPIPFGGYAFADDDTQVAISIAAPGALGSGYC